jgi:hypothetical protein
MVFIGKTLSFVRAYADEVDRALRRIDPAARLNVILTHFTHHAFLSIWA